MKPWSWGDGISAHGLETFQACKEQFRLKYKERLEPRFTPMSLYFGGICHHVLLRATQESESIAPEEALINEWVSEFHQQHSQEVAPSDRQEVERILGHAYAVMCEYFPFHEADNKKRKIIDTEMQFKTKINIPGEGQTSIFGTMDSVFLKGKKKLWIEDTKTSSTFFNETLSEDAFPTVLQFNLYMVAYEILTGTYPTGIVLNQIRRPSLKLTKQDGDLVTHLGRVREDIHKRPEYYFQRTEAEFTPREINDWKTNQLIPMLIELKMWDEGVIPHYYNPAALTSFNRRSEFFDAIVFNNKSELKTGTYLNKYLGE